MSNLTYPDCCMGVTLSGLTVTFCSVTPGAVTFFLPMKSKPRTVKPSVIIEGFPVCVLIAFNQHQIPKARFNDSVSDLMESLLTP